MTTKQIVSIEPSLLWKMVNDVPGSYVAICKHTNLCAKGRTYGELQKSISFTLRSCFKQLFMNNELENFLQEKDLRLKNLKVSEIQEGAKFDLIWKLER